jgi:DNA-directed RNA polymerase subunit L/DNA-directed RNA polymerase alpha subunit
MQFTNLQKEDRIYTFSLSPIHVTYANTLRRLILTGVTTVAFRSDMTSTGSTTDVIVKRNDTPMTNEMLADRIGLLPIYVPDPLNWKDDDYLFTLKVIGNNDATTYVKSSHFKITKNTPPTGDDEKEENISTERFFPVHPITRDTCLIATLQPGAIQQAIEIEAKATKGTGREHARFSPVSQCSYEYTPDPNPRRMEEMFTSWLTITKKVGAIDKASDRYQELKREFNTMQIKRCFLINEKGEPYSFDFTIESAGVLEVPYIVEQACQVGENMCSRYVTLDRGDVPSDITITSADTRIIGYDFLFRGHDHTLGNLLQTWLVEHHIEGDAQPNITYAGYSVPHPLRDEMILRIGVEDGEESTARLAVARAALGCVKMFQNMRLAWRSVNGAPLMSGLQQAIPGSKLRSAAKASATASASATATAKTSASK